MKGSTKCVSDIADPPPRYFHAEPKTDLGLQRSSEPRWPSARLLVTGLVVVLGGCFHFGFQISLINPMAEVLKEFIVDSFVNRFGLEMTGIVWKLVWPSVAGILFVGAALGAFAATPLMEKFGAKFALLASSMILTTSFLLAIGSKIFRMAELFIVARLMSGFGIGMATTTSGVYLTEISPIALRGTMGTTIGFSTNVGFVSASALGLPHLLGHPDRWHLAYVIGKSSRLLLVSPIAFRTDSMRRSPPLDRLLLSRVTLLPSPLPQTRRSRRIRAGPPAMEHELSEALETRESGWADLLRNRSFRWAVAIAATVNVTVSFSGIMAVSFFGTFLLTAIGFSENGAALANFIASFAGTAGAILSSLTVDKLGRRSLLIGSLLILSLINTTMMVNTAIFLNYNAVWTGYIFLFFFHIFLFVFSFGVGPLAWFLSTELTFAPHRSKVQSIAVAAQYISCFLSPLFFYPLQNTFGPLSFLIFIAPTALTAVFLYYYLPETRLRQTEDIVRELEGTSLFKRSELKTNARRVK
ncbi:hypothetical protein QR680_018326 [Steinernema hermaphroditum]|uniref:Major facilitator superfamily (MFS) profile domain-containing protein n=1 Tax=Steinernema hermaphroditum TaxID=289476 RepID=A0AA39HJU8_9BILA|nr:hypothetical protein QR680_018326 [Steinernema hermaphroditum]